VQVPDGPLTLSKTQAATRQVEAAIEAIERCASTLPLPWLGRQRACWTDRGIIFLIIC
jgi:hypothetical protein